MKLKIVLLPKKTNSQPVPYWDVGMIAENVRPQCRSVELKDLETANFYTKKYDAFLEKYRPEDIFKKENRIWIKSLVADIGTLAFDIVYFYIDWWNETLPLAIEVARHIKQSYHKVKIVISGPYLNSYGQDMVRRFKFLDYVVVSEVEPAFQKMIDSNADISEIPNVLYFDKQKNTVIETQRRLADLNRLAFPNFDCFFNGQYPASKILPFRVSRGCKYRCFFCACLSGEKLRYYQDIDAVVEKLKDYRKQYHIQKFYFEDDALNFDNAYLESFLDKVILEDLDIQWSAYFIAKDLTPDLITKVAQAGCTHIRWGIESLDPSFSKKIAKNIEVNEARVILTETARVGISNQVSFIVGFPYEKKQSVDRIKDFIAANAGVLKVVNVYAFKPRAGTAAHQIPERYGIKILDDKKIFRKDVVPFDEIHGMRWERKRIAQQIFLKDVESAVQRTQLLDVDPKEYFKRSVEK